MTRVLLWDACTINRVPRSSQEPVHQQGRVNQKRRTRKAIVDAAQAILERGERPTVARAAEEAMVSRTTAYRYFPDQESLLLELSVRAELTDVEELLTQPLDDTSPQARLLEVVDTFNRHGTANEILYRSGLRHYMEVWLAAERAGEGHEYQVREGRRLRWIAAVLEPLGDRLARPDLERVQAALCLVMGPEAITVLRDICQLDPDAVIAVTHWAADAILTAGLSASPTPDSAALPQMKTT
jgi:AcrR family transcriptional regulator